MEEKKKRGRQPKTIAPSEIYGGSEEEAEMRKLVYPSVSQLELWEQQGVPCSYVRFQQPIPAYENSEPVGEFRLSTNGPISAKYHVDSISYTPHGVIWRCKGEIDISALSNVMYSRALK